MDEANILFIQGTGRYEAKSRLDFQTLEKCLTLRQTQTHSGSSFLRAFRCFNAVFKGQTQNRMPCPGNSHAKKRYILSFLLYIMDPKKQPIEIRVCVISGTIR